MKEEEVRVPGTTELEFGETDTRGLTTSLVLTFLTLTVFVGLVWLSALRSSVDGVTTSTGARAAIVALSASFLLAVFVRSLTVWTPGWLPWVGVAITTSFVTVAASLFQTRNLDAAFAFYGGFQVPRAGRLFSDSHGLLSWYSCAFCEEWEALYGPGMKAVFFVTGGQIGISWLPFLGLLFAVIALVSIYILGRVSSSLGRWLIAASAASPAWLLLVERANWDVPILGVLVIGGVLVAARPCYLTWTIFAVAIWTLGTIKIYPFALGLVILLALGMRWGWVVVAGFSVATGLFVITYFDALLKSGGLHSSPELLAYEAGASPAYGRELLARQIASVVPDSIAPLVTLALLLAVVLFAGCWGWIARMPETSRQVRMRLAILSSAGAIAFLAKALVVGFGFAYAGAALLLVVPAIVVQPNSRSLRNGSMVALSLLILLAVFGSYNVILGTLAGTVVAGFGLGFGVRIVWEMVRPRFSGDRRWEAA